MQLEEPALASEHDGMGSLQEPLGRHVRRDLPNKWYPFTQPNVTVLPTLPPPWSVLITIWARASMAGQVSVCVCVCV